jgi:ubiquinol-cytochrome c reductase cytochrome b/c1 subunit
MKVKSARYRPLYKIFFLLFVIFCLLLGYLGAKPPEGIYLFLSRVSTIYYFAFFLVIMPILSRIEKPSPMPIGISNPAINNEVFDSGGGTTGTPSYAMDSK